MWSGGREFALDRRNPLPLAPAEPGESATAVRLCREALSVLQELGDRYGEALTWDSLGYAYHQLGEHDTAVDCFQRSVDLMRYLGDSYNEVKIPGRLADVRAGPGTVPVRS